MPVSLSVEKLLTKFDVIVDFFIPNFIQHENEYVAARVLVKLCVYTLMVVLLFLANRIRLNGFFNVYSIVMAMGAVGLVIIPFVLKITGLVKSCNKILILSLSGLVMTMAYVTGGPLAPALAFFPAFPFGGILFVSFRFGGFLGLLMLCYIIFLTWANQNGLLPQGDMNQEISGPLHSAATIAVGIVFAFLGASYVGKEAKLRDKLLRESQAKSEFLSGMSHELRTPLNAIMGFSDLLQRGSAGALNEKQATYSSTIFESSTHMLALVNDLLDIAKIESGELDFYVESVEPKRIIQECKGMMTDIAAAKSIRIETVLDRSLEGRTAVLDGMKFKQIILNLLSNAIKFSPEQRKVTLAAVIVDDNLVVIVSDEGEGIPFHSAKKIFDRFYQAPDCDGNRAVGTGLGLPISRLFAEFHKGTLELMPRAGEGGACFKLVLPLKSEECIAA